MGVTSSNRTSCCARCASSAWRHRVRPRRLPARRPRRTRRRRCAGHGLAGGRPVRAGRPARPGPRPAARASSARWTGSSRPTPPPSSSPPPPARGLRRPSGRSTTRAGRPCWRNLDRITAAAAARGLVATLHPHVGTMIESGEETERVLAGSRHRPVPRHRAPAHRRRRPGRHRPRSTPSGSPTRTSRTSGSTWPRRVQAGDAHLHRGRRRRHVRPARRGRRRHRRHRGRARGQRVCAGGTSSSRTPSSPGAAARARARAGGGRAGEHRLPARPGGAALRSGDLT